MCGNPSQPKIKLYQSGTFFKKSQHPNYRHDIKRGTFPKTTEVVALKVALFTATTQGFHSQWRTSPIGASCPTLLT